MKTNWKAFNIAMPKELIPIYDFLQQEFNYFLTNYKQELSCLDLSKHRGKLWLEIRDILKDRVNNWTIHNKAWHAIMVFENIRRELQSKTERLKVYEILQDNQFIVNQELRDRLVENKLFPTNALLRNMARSQKVPTIPDSAVFNLDYSISEKQFFRMDKTGLCQIKVSKTDWIEYQILIPASVNHQLTGYIAKPRFIKRKSDGSYIGVCSYEYIPVKNDYKNILGADLGKCKLYSAVAIDTNGNHSKEFINSKRLQKQKEKIDRLQEEYAILCQKKRAYERLNYYTNKTKRVIANYFDVKNKITRIKDSQAKMLADELVNLAVELECGEIHLENLSWLESKGGKWNFSMLQSKIEEQAQEFSIKVVKVNACDSSKTHPITEELGSIQGRKIKFKNSEFDRDFIAALNIAKRNKKGAENKIKKVKKVQTVRTKIKSNRKEIKEKVNKLKGKNQIVFFLPNVVKTSNIACLTVWPIDLGKSKTISFLSKIAKSDRFW